MTDEALSRATIHQIAWQIRDDEADPADAKKLLREVVRYLEQSDASPPELERHLRDSLARYLSGECPSLDRAFGLTRKSGRPKADEYDRIEMAAEVLRARIAGATHQDALRIAGDRCHKSESVIGEAWAAHKFNGLIMLRVERDHDRYPWSAEEVEKLTEILGKDPWFLAPENSPNKSV